MLPAPPSEIRAWMWGFHFKSRPKVCRTQIKLGVKFSDLFILENMRRTISWTEENKRLRRGRSWKIYPILGIVMMTESLNLMMSVISASIFSDWLLGNLICWIVWVIWIDIALSFAPTDFCARNLNSLACSWVKCSCEFALSRLARWVVCVEAISFGEGASFNKE